MEYCVDIVLCIDSTGSMGEIIGEAKASALVFKDDLLARMKEINRNIDTLRVKVISFRDYYCDGDEAMDESDFFAIPESAKLYEACIAEIHAKGGGDPPESGLEAVALAMKSDWTHEGRKRRHVICLWTDDAAHPLEGHENGIPKPSTYPSGLPANLDELLNTWKRMEFKAKRLVIFAPDAYPWNEIESNFGNVIQYVSEAGKGLKDNNRDYQQIVQAIAESLEVQ